MLCSISGAALEFFVFMSLYNEQHLKPAALSRWGNKIWVCSGQERIVLPEIVESTKCFRSNQYRSYCHRDISYQSFVRATIESSQELFLKFHKCWNVSVAFRKTCQNANYCSWITKTIRNGSYWFWDFEDNTCGIGLQEVGILKNSSHWLNPLVFLIPVIRDWHLSFSFVQGFDKSICKGPCAWTRRPASFLRNFFRSVHLPDISNRTVPLEHNYLVWSGELKNEYGQYLVRKRRGLSSGGIPRVALIH